MIPSASVPRRAYLAVVAVLALAACGGDGPETDAGVVADTSLVPILVDLHLADARAETTGEPSDSLRSVALTVHGLDSTAFAARLLDATRVPEDASALYQAVTDRLQATAVQTAELPRP